MTIFKKTYTERFTVQPNTTITDSRLSFAARGLLAYLLSKPKDWEVRTADLVNASPAGISAVRSMVRELEEHGYLVKTRTRNSAGIFIGQVTEVYDEPQQDCPQSGFPHVDNPKVDNQTLLSKEKKQKTKRLTKDVSPFIPQIPDNLNNPAFLEAWDNWNGHRKEIKKRQTPRSMNTQLKVLATIGTDRAIAAIEHSIMQGYTGIYEAKQYKGSGNAIPVKQPQYVPDADGRF